MASSIKAALLQQVVIVLLLPMLFADRMHVLLICFASVIGFWTVLLIVRSRRPLGSERHDLILVQLGFYVFLVNAWLIGRCFFLLRHYLG